MWTDLANPKHSRGSLNDLIVPRVNTTPPIRADDRLIDPSQTARERSRNIIRNPEVRDPLLNVL